VKQTRRSGPIGSYFHRLASSTLSGLAKSAPQPRPSRWEAS